MTNQYTTGAGQKLRVHPTALCTGPCAIHSPSEHHMIEWPTYWRSDRGMMERTCPHGIGHPDPDDTSANRVHGCDLCCLTPEDREGSTPEAHEIQ